MVVPTILTAVPLMAIWLFFVGRHTWRKVARRQPIRLVRGLVIGRYEDIEVVGEDISQIIFHFQQTDNAISRIGKQLWFGPLKSLQKLMVHTPLVYAFIFGSFSYHDYIWRPIKGKRRMRQIQDSEWYKLFQSYKT